jgi:hypothetical protein
MDSKKIEASRKEQLNMTTHLKELCFIIKIHVVEQ